MSKDNINLSLKIIIQKGNCLYYEKELDEKKIEKQTADAEEWAMKEISQLNFVESLKNKYYETGLKLLLFLVIAKYLSTKENLNDKVLFNVALIARKCLKNKDKIEIDFNNLFLEH